MKKTLLSLLVSVLFLSLAAFASDDENPDQASSDLIYKHFSMEEFNIRATKSSLPGIPKSVVCGDNYKIVFAKSLSDGEFEPGLLISAIDPNEMMLNGNDGDQVDMIKMKLSELRALAKGQVSSVLALTASGFWWADGDHIEAGTVLCTLPKAAQ